MPPICCIVADICVYVCSRIASYAALGTTERINSCVAARSSFVAFWATAQAATAVIRTNTIPVLTTTRVPFRMPER